MLSQQPSPRFTVVRRASPAPPPGAVGDAPAPPPTPAPLTKAADEPAPPPAPLPRSRYPLCRPLLNVLALALFLFTGFLGTEAAILASRLTAGSAAPSTLLGLAVARVALLSPPLPAPRPNATSYAPGSCSPPLPVALWLRSRNSALSSLTLSSLQLTVAPVGGGGDAPPPACPAPLLSLSTRSLTLASSRTLGQFLASGPFSTSPSSAAPLTDDGAAAAAGYQPVASSEGDGSLVLAVGLDAGRDWLQCALGLVTGVGGAPPPGVNGSSCGDVHVAASGVVWPGALAPLGVSLSVGATLRVTAALAAYGRGGESAPPARRQLAAAPSSVWPAGSALAAAAAALGFTLPSLRLPFDPTGDILLATSGAAAAADSAAAASPAVAGVVGSDGSCACGSVSMGDPGALVPPSWRLGSTWGLARVDLSSLLGVRFAGAGVLVCRAATPAPVLADAGLLSALAEQYPSHGATAGATPPPTRMNIAAEVGGVPPFLRPDLCGGAVYGAANVTAEAGGLSPEVQGSVFGSGVSRGTGGGAAWDGGPGSATLGTSGARLSLRLHVLGPGDGVPAALADGGVLDVAGAVDAGLQVVGLRWDVGGSQAGGFASALAGGLTGGGSASATSAAGWACSPGAPLLAVTVPYVAPTAGGPAVVHPLAPLLSGLFACGPQSPWLAGGGSEPSAPAVRGSPPLQVDGATASGWSAVVGDGFTLGVPGVAPVCDAPGSPGEPCWAPAPPTPAPPTPPWMTLGVRRADAPPSSASPAGSMPPPTAAGGAGMGAARFARVQPTTPHARSRRGQSLPWASGPASPGGSFAPAPGGATRPVLVPDDASGGLLGTAVNVLLGQASVTTWEDLSWESLPPAPRHADGRSCSRERHPRSRSRSRGRGGRDDGGRREHSERVDREKRVGHVE